MTRPQVTEEDKQYLLQAVHYMFPSLQLKIKHIKSSWAGLRPLIADQDANHPGEISRKDEIFNSPTGLLSIAGGKLTGYRKMAENIFDLVTKQLKKEEGIIYSASSTKHLPISGGDVGGASGFVHYKQKKIKEGMAKGLKEQEAVFLVEVYGSNAPLLFDYYTGMKKEAERMAMPRILLARLVYAIEYEAVCTPADFFVRRTGALFFHIDEVYQWKQLVIDYMEGQLHWTKEQKAQYTTELNQLLYESTQQDV